MWLHCANGSSPQTHFLIQYCIFVTGYIYFKHHIHLHLISDLPECLQIQASIKRLNKTNNCFALSLYFTFYQLLFCYSVLLWTEFSIKASGFAGLQVKTQHLKILLYLYFFQMLPALFTCFYDMLLMSQPGLGQCNVFFFLFILCQFIAENDEKNVP